LNTGDIRVCDTDNLFLSQKGVEISQLDNNNLVTKVVNDTSYTYLLENNSIVFKHDTSDTHFYIQINEQRLNLDSIFNSTMQQWVSDETELNDLKWQIIRVYKIRTQNKVYLLFYFFNTLNNKLETYYPVIVNVSAYQMPFYILQSIRLSGINYLGDFNNDSFLDYAFFNDENKIIEFYSLSNTGINKVDSIFLEVRERNIPMQYYTIYKIKRVQKHSKWWFKGKFMFSINPL